MLLRRTARKARRCCLTALFNMGICMTRACFLPPAPRMLLEGALAVVQYIASLFLPFHSERRVADNVFQVHSAGEKSVTSRHLRTRCRSGLCSTVPPRRIYRLQRYPIEIAETHCNENWIRTDSPRQSILSSKEIIPPPNTSAILTGDIAQGDAQR